MSAVTNGFKKQCFEV